MLKLYIETDDVQELLMLFGVGSQISAIGQRLETLIMKTDEELTALKAIDAATTAIGVNVQKIADTTQVISTGLGTISTEIDNLLANTNVPKDVSDTLLGIQGKITTLGTAAQASSDALDAQVPVLNAIATKGAGTPVPVEPPPPPPEVGAAA